MKIIDFEQLDYLHDAVVEQITLTSTSTTKALVMNITCDDDCGYSHWCGKGLTVTFVNVLRTSGTLFGHVTGYDTIQSLDVGASVEMEQSIRQLFRMGITSPPVMVRLTFHSGSELEIACDAIDVRVEE